jgi:hypothetical protein
MSDEILYEVRGPKTLFEMTWPQVKELLTKTKTVVIPVGSTEQHGHHLPLGSDSMQGTDMVKRLIKKFADNGITVAGAPTMPFGISHAHMKFPGSITISSKTLMAVLTEVVQSLYHHGFRNYVLLLAHGGNLPTLRLLANDLALQYQDIKVIEQHPLAVLKPFHMMSSDPAYLLLKPGTLQVISRIQRIRKEKGLAVAFTLDAGPNVHLIYPGYEREKVLPFIREELLPYCHQEQWIDDRMGPGPEELITGPHFIA